MLFGPELSADPRVRRTKTLLQDAMRMLVKEKRFSEITVQDIAARATVNRATFYAHYVDKQDLAASLLKFDLHNALMQMFAEPPPLNRENLVVFASIVYQFIAGLNADCRETAIELQDTVGVLFQQDIYEVLMCWLAKNGAYRRLFPGSSREMVATVLSWSIYGGADGWSRSDRLVPVEEACRELIGVLLP